MALAFGSRLRLCSMIMNPGDCHQPSKKKIEDRHLISPTPWLSSTAGQHAVLTGREVRA
jgi:hypothetical protein